jgi:hypothetical protein
VDLKDLAIYSLVALVLLCLIVFVWRSRVQKRSNTIRPYEALDGSIEKIIDKADPHEPNRFI